MEGMHQMHFKWLLGIVAISAFATTCRAQYRVLPGTTDSDGCEPTTPARICLGATGEAHCYAPPNDKYGDSSDEQYIFGLEPKAKVVGRLNGRDLILFTAMFSGCGSGTLTHFSLLTVRDGEFVNLLPKVELTNQSEYKFWTLPQISGLPVLVTADFIWGSDPNESHFAPHHYSVSVYAFDGKIGRYLRLVRYETTKKYPGLDDADEIHVLGAERPIVLAKLRHGQIN